jgi:D-alanyl-D-alanine carboxypeptidase (penicillin-binding protein 5/6)
MRAGALGLGQEVANGAGSGRRRDRGRRRRRRDLSVLGAVLALVGVLVASQELGALPHLARTPLANVIQSTAVSRLGLGGQRSLPKRLRALPLAGPSAPTSSAVTFSVLTGLPAPPANLGVHAQSAVLVDLDQEEILWQRDPHVVRAPASLAKLVTAMVAADLAPLDRPVTVAPDADAKALLKVEPDSTLMGLSAGEVLTVRELLYGLFLRSGNDAAEALARGIVPRDRFIDLMNAKAAAIGMKDSHFTSPIGLDAPGMHSTAYDLAVAAATIDERYPTLAEIASTKELELPQTPTHKAFQGENWLHSFLNGYPGATGMKTGFTDNAGGCVVATATRDNRHLIVVAMHSQSFVTDAEKLLDYGFSLPTASLARPLAAAARPAG